MSEHPPTLHSAHPSEAPLHYEDEHHMGRAPVTAMHDEDDDPYSPFDEGRSMMRAPSTINVQPSHAMQGDDYFGQPMSDSPRGTVFHPGGVHEVPLEHVETAHDSNVISLDQRMYGHAGPTEHISVAGVSRQPVRISTCAHSFPAAQPKLGPYSCGRRFSRLATLRRPACSNLATKWKSTPAIRLPSSSTRALRSRCVPRIHVVRLV